MIKGEGTGRDQGGDRAGDVIMATFGCDGELGELLVRKARFNAYPARATILAEGEPCQHVHVLTEGHARKQVVSIEGRMVMLEEYFAGDLFGESGLTTEDAANEEVRAVKPTRTGAFPNHEFTALISVHAPIALAVSRILVSRLIQTSRRFSEGFTLTATGRIHAELLRRAQPLAALPGQLAIDPVPVFAEFALSVQSTRETVSRAVSALEKRGIVRRAGTALVIVAPHRLEELVY